MTRLVRITRVVLGLLLLALLVAVVGIAGFARVAPATGHPVLIIRSGSMVPTIPVGAAVVLSAGYAGVQPGDVVAMRLDNGAVFTHRVTRLASLGGIPYVETKGDANRDVDPALTPLDHVIGRVSVTLPVAGYLMAALSTPSGVASVLFAALALVVALWFLDDEEELSSEPGPVGVGSPGSVGSVPGVATAASGAHGWPA